MLTEELSPKAQEIAARTRALLTAGGYHSFSYADLAAKVNITKASIHHHFPSKAQLVKTVVVQHREQMMQGLAQLESQLGDPVATLNAYVDHWAECIRTNAPPFCINAMLATELPTVPEEVAVEVRAHFEGLSDWLESVLTKGARRGRIQLRQDAASEARSLMAVVHGAMLVARALGDAGAFHTVVQPALRALVKSS
ncbi:TetR/AcrR family transcriptional regulator [Piscinibacter sp. HJYY11]|uniref:TetR/AcrR family transcriptional regulator n=1 Tax=Piscinibacter sp. HJYY11 TaxID=2801333 RepID=UPI00191E82F5|nr:TetR/AcrR family transcriptional regulator [Piscinibacter sp. HJYY11]MBL0727306.1 TetR/AcrR family transcriptional regulator [Piscinibacter sp. HJYY11]